MGWIPSTVIHHHFDPMMDVLKCVRPEGFAPGYLGYRFNALYLDEIPMRVVEDPNQWVGSMKSFNLHYNVREPKDDLLKPATKIAAAAGAGANIITLRSPIAMELLGNDYPYYINNISPGEVRRVFDKAKDEFGGEEWKRGVDIMAQLRPKLDLNLLVKKYAQVLSGGPL